MKIAGINSFIERDFPGLIQTENLQVLFATYKEVHGYKDGLVDTGDDKLKIVVLSGNHEYSRDVYNLMFIPSLDAIKESERLGIEECRTAQDLVEGCFTDAKRSLNKEGETLIFVYVGLSAFDESVLFARNARRDFPNAKIIVLTCDCSRDTKEKKFGLIDDIDYAIIGRECGGRGEMKKLLDYIISNRKSVGVPA